MSKIVTFLNRDRSYSLTRNVLITNMNLVIPDPVYENIEFVQEVKIIVFSGDIEQQLKNEENIEEIYDTIGIINPCNMLWNGYGKYLKYAGMKCDKTCEESKCKKYDTYEEYVKNKQMRVIPQFTKLVIDD